VVAGALVAGGPVAIAAHGTTGPQCNTDWPVAGHDVTHTASVSPGCTPIQATNASQLVPSWYVHTPDSVTSSPVVVGHTLYVGSWDGTFYAVDTQTGKTRWTFDIRTTAPTAFGRIDSTAAVVPFSDATAAGGKRLVVVFGGGSSVWALDAATGHELASQDVDPRDPAARAADPSQVVEVESSPAVADVRVGNQIERRIFVGMDLHDADKVGRTGLVALRLSSAAGKWHFDPAWKLDPETGQTFQGPDALTAESGKGFGCGGVWSSPAIDLADGLVAFGTANCDNADAAEAAGENWSEEMIAARLDTGAIAWKFRPATTLAQAHADDDFGASANVFTTQSGKRIIGEGRKDSCYYARYAATGNAAWSTCVGTPGNLSDGFAIGGYLGTPAVQTDSRGRAVRIIGATAIPTPTTMGARKVVNSLLAVRALDPENGHVLWTYRLAGPTYGSTTVAGGLAFVPDTTTSSVIVLDAALGVPVTVLPVIGPPSSAAAIVGNSVYITGGTRETDLEYKAFGLQVQQLEAAGGASPLSPISGIQRFTLPLPTSPALPAS
jgi:outer membrane protein assembly factor BamB